MTINLIDGMKYIGKKNYDNRGIWKKYLGSGIRLRRAIKKYGRESFIRIILDEAESPDELNYIERNWIDMFEACDNREFYNIAAGGDGGYVTSGYTQEKRDEIERKRIESVKNANTGKHNNSSAKLNEEQVRKIINELLDRESYTDIAKRYGVAIETIRDIANHKTWKFLTMGISFPDASKHKRQTNGKVVYQYTREWEYIAVYENMHIAEKYTGVGFRLISQVCNGDKPTAHGFRFTLEPICKSG